MSENFCETAKTPVPTHKLFPAGSEGTIASKEVRRKRFEAVHDNPRSCHCDSPGQEK